MKKRFLLIIITLALSLPNIAQEIYCNVQLNSRQVQGSEKSIFEDLQRSIFEFINNRKWTGYQFQVEEKIE